MPYNIPDRTFEDFITEVQDDFVEELRRRLTATQFFSETLVRDLGVKTYEWREINDTDEDVSISMEIPEPSQSDAGTIEKQSLDIPVLKKDIHYDGRDWLAYQAAGLDTVDAQQKARRLAEEVNDYLYYGDSNGVGPSTGLLNDSDILTLDNSGSTDWTQPDDVLADLAEAKRELLENFHRGPYTLLMDPFDSDLFPRRRANTDTTVEESIPDNIQGPVFDHVINNQTGTDSTSSSGGRAYLLEAAPDNFDAVTPFGVGSVRREVMEGNNMMGEGVWVRFLTALAPRVIRPTSIIEITFDRGV